MWFGLSLQSTSYVYSASISFYFTYASSPYDLIRDEVR